MAKPKALPKGVLNSRQMLSKINKESDSLGLVLMYGTENYMIDGAVSMLKKACLGEGAEDMDYAVIDTRTGDKFDMGKLEELISMPPWMSPRRLVVIKQSGLPNRELSDRDVSGIFRGDRRQQKEGFQDVPSVRNGCFHERI